MSLSPQAIKSAFFNVLYSASAGTAVRAALGNGATSVIAREDLTATSLPTPPFIALQWGTGGGPRNREVRTFLPVWWLYDAPAQRHFRLEALIPLIEAAYAEDAIRMCYLDFLPVRELTDAALNMPVKSFPFQIRTRG